MSKTQLLKVPFCKNILVRTEGCLLLFNKRTLPRKEVIKEFNLYQYDFGPLKYACVARQFS